MLDIIHDQYDQDLPAIIPLCAPIQGAGDDRHVSETCGPPSEPDDHRKGLGHTVREPMNRFQADRLSSHADKARHDDEESESSMITSGLTNPYVVSLSQYMLLYACIDLVNVPLPSQNGYVTS